MVGALDYNEVMRESLKVDSVYQPLPECNRYLAIYGQYYYSGLTYVVGFVLIWSGATYAGHAITPIKQRSEAEVVLELNSIVFRRMLDMCLDSAQLAQLF